MKTITINLKSPHEVLTELKEKVSESVYPTLSIAESGKETPWVWVSNTKQEDKDTASKLKAIGFKWSRRRSAWYHTCETDVTKFSYGRRRWKPTSKSNTSKKDVKKSDLKKFIATKNVDEEFARRFG